MSAAPVPDEAESPRERARRWFERPFDDVEVDGLSRNVTGVFARDVLALQDQLDEVARENDRLYEAIRDHNSTKRSPGCGHALNHADERLWAAIGVDRWGDPLEGEPG